jgi:ADP-heptose:LPS heptosyltransferase/glycosyltransferase involved in cell wall biosynthesis
LIVGMDSEGHIHTHGDIDNKAQVQEMLDSASAAAGLSARIEKKELPKEIVFRNKQRLGDSLMFTCGVRDFKKAFPDIRVNVVATAMHVWDNNPYIDPTLKPTEQNTIMVGPGRGTNQSNSVDWHFANAYRMSMEEALKIHIPQGESRPDIWFTQEEYDAPRVIDKPYWVICVNGEKGWGCKMYPFERWQQVVDDNPMITFVQIGTREDDAPRLKGSNVIDYIGKTQDKNTGIRDLFKLFLNAEGSIGLVSFHMHLSGALNKPCIVVAGAREPVSFTQYAGHRYLATDGALPCAIKACWHCELSKCTNLVDTPDKMDKQIPKCVDMISPSDISQAIHSYYVGKRLTYDTPSEKPKPRHTNIVKTPKHDPVKAPIDFGKGAIDPSDWPFIEDILKRYKIKNVLEFGAGLSTTLISKYAFVRSYETEQDWIDKIKPLENNFEIRKWNGRDFTDPIVEGQYDLAFVDGPANGQNREEAVRIAVNYANIVILHDATRNWESKWEEKYLKPGFSGPIKGGKWCHLWIKTPSFEKFSPPPPPRENPHKKRIKIVSTARGWGGCARSVTTIMKLLLKSGHEVEFVPFRNEVTSREFIDVLKNGLSPVKVSKSYDAIKTPCDVLLVYADDFVWEFPKLEPLFSDLQASRKIMMLNYRRGGVGEIQWTKGWDRYLFLNYAQRDELLRVLPGVDTGIYPPCADLEPFFEAKIDYDKPLTIVRHNSQGDVKFDKENEEAAIMKALELRPESHIHMLPGPSWVNATERFHKHPKTGIPDMIRKFLEMGNLFWYSLPKGYMDMGPRVILEAMAAGLPIIADNWGGAPDRVTSDCGWICESKQEMLDVIKTVTPQELRKKGTAARQRALNDFRPERWVTELTGELEYA